MTARKARTGLLGSLGRPGRRATAAAVLVAGSALLIAGCGAGQISQTATQEPAVGGNQVDLNPIALRDVRIAYPTEQEYTNSKGGKAALAFVAVNEDPNQADRLSRITTDVGNVSVGQPSDVPAGGKLVAEAPGTTVTPVELQATGNAPIRVEVTDLTQDLTPGLTVPFTFTFERAGEVTVRVPIDAGADLQRQESDKSSTGEHHESGSGGTQGSANETGGAGAGSGGQ